MGAGVERIFGLRASLVGRPRQNRKRAVVAVGVALALPGRRRPACVGATGSFVLEASLGARPRDWRQE